MIKEIGGIGKLWQRRYQPSYNYTKNGYSISNCKAHGKPLCFRCKVYDSTQAVTYVYYIK